MFVRAYLRASTSEQDATRARAQLDAFAHERGLAIAAIVLDQYGSEASKSLVARPRPDRALIAVVGSPSGWLSRGRSFLASTWRPSGLKATLWTHAACPRRVSS